MKKGWRITLVVFLILVLLGAAALLVGYLTGADFSRLFSLLKPWIDHLQDMWNWVVQTGLGLLDSVKQLFL